MFFVAKIKYSDYDDNEKVAETLMWAESYPDAMSCICRDWADIIEVSLHQISFEDDGPYIDISHSMADAFMNDIVTDVYCIESEWRRNKREEKENK